MGGTNKSFIWDREGTMDMHTSKSVVFSSKGILGIEDLACALSRGFTETKVSTRQLITKHWIMLYHPVSQATAIVMRTCVGWSSMFIIHADDSTTLAACHIHVGRSSRMTMRGLLASQGLIQYLVIMSCGYLCCFKTRGHTKSRISFYQKTTDLLV